MRGILPCVALAAVVCASMGCSIGSTQRQQPVKNSLWTKAEEAFAAEEYSQVVDTLERLEDQGGPRSYQAAAWRMIMLAAQARGYFEVSESYESGAEKNYQHRASFRRAAADYRSRSRTALLGLAEMARYADRHLGAVEAIDLSLPVETNSDAPSSVLANVSLGRPVEGPSVARAVNYTLRRALLLTVAETAGCRDAVAEIDQRLNAGGLQTPRTVFLASIGRVLYEQAEIFTEKRLNDLTKRDLLLDLSDGLLKIATQHQAEQQARLDVWRVELDRRRARP